MLKGRYKLELIELLETTLFLPVLRLRLDYEL